MPEVRTNSELAELINSNHKEVTDRLGRVEAQVKLTNGRVKELERVKIAEDAVNAYKDKVQNDKHWDVNTLLTILLVIGTLAGAIATVVWVRKVK